MKTFSNIKNLFKTVFCSHIYVNESIWVTKFEQNNEHIMYEVKYKKCTKCGKKILIE